MLQNRPISEIMTEDLQVVEKHKELHNVVDILTEYSVQHVPIVEEGRLVGLVSAGDIMEYSMDVLSKRFGQPPDNSKIKHAKIEEIMQTDLITLSTRSTVLAAAEILSRGDIHSVPIIDDQENLVGIVTSSDLINFLTNQLQLDLPDVEER